MNDIILPLSLLLILYLLIKDIYLNRKIREVTDFIQELSEGNLRKRLFLKKGEKFSGIVSGLNRIAESFEEKIHEANEQSHRLESTLNNLPDGIVLLDNNGMVRFVNPAFETLFNVKASQLMGRGLNEVIRVPELSELIEITRTDRSLKKEAFIEPIDKHLQIKVIPFFGNSITEDKSHSPASREYTGAMIVFRDITEGKRTDETRRDFVANVSHELKTPITAIRGFTETLLDGAIEDRNDALRFLNTIKAHTERMDRLIGDLIKLSRIEFGAMPLEKTSLPLEPLVDDVFKGFETLCQGKGISLEKDMQKGCSVIEADPHRLIQILTNLVDNAVKFTESGHVTVKTGMQGSGYIISVEDTGMGIPRRHLSRLGERFFRVDPSRSRELGGTGLGLAIVKHLVRAHGWEMKIESEEGKGTAVRILLPEPYPAEEKLSNCSA
ncbi:Phosphate regulon sensor protein PhoR (SphS) [hydrothermal vent metagenome]|uniref:histidine kinase n=1 Tax=hydrothermal vent metagenome TaxID=652676 RepID=A0A3B1CCG6_9ZZZZ